MENGISVLVTVGFLSVIVQLVIERLRARVASLDADLVNVVAIAAGTGLAYLYGLQAAAELGLDGLPVSLDYLATGIAIAGVSGIIAASKNKNRAQDPNSSIHRVG